MIHYTAMDSCEGAARALCDPAREVSAHYLISEAGEVLALVDEAERAWHAGAGSWRGWDDVNSRSIGIELSNSGLAPFAAAQMDALEELLSGIMARWDIPPSGVIAHSDLAPGRKIDPGTRFDWQRLARRGLAVWPTPVEMGVDWTQFLANLHDFGYGAEVHDEVLLAAFRLRFNPGGTGDLSAQDCARAAGLNPT